MNKSLLTADNIGRLFYYRVQDLIMAAKYTVLLDNGCSIRVYQSFIANITYYASIMLNAFSDLLCLKLCWHNRLVPNRET